MSGLLTAWSRLLLGSLRRAGVRHAVISPGSRSTPLVCAALESGMSCTNVVDERSAGFFAVGQAKQSGEPSLLVCTSGSAAANYLPALVEARSAHVPLMVLTADRPFELMDCGAPQTIDQSRLYGQHALAFVELGLPGAEPAALRALMQRAARAVATARGPLAGPVHLNARARKPLEPRPDAELTRRVDTLLERGPTRFFHPRPIPPDDALAIPPDDALEPIASDLSRATRPLFVFGPLSAWQRPAPERLASLGAPMVVEAASGLRFAGHDDIAYLEPFDLLLDAGVFDRHPPDVVVEVGGTPVSGAWQRYLAEHPATLHHVLSPAGMPDASSSARSVVVGDLDAALQRLAQLQKLDSARSAWIEHVRERSGRAWRVVQRVVADRPRSEAVAVQHVVDSLPQGGLLALGNSLPVREVDAYCPPRRGDILVFSQRGANGIDGVISSAAGAAAHSGRPTTLLVGDVSTVHDVGGLAAARTVTTPFVVVVLDNGGGRLFEQLPIASAGLGATALDHWLTPHGLELERAGTLFGFPSERVRSLGELPNALARAHRHPGASLLVVALDPHEAAETRRAAVAALAEEERP